LPQVARAAATAGVGWVVLNRQVDYVTELRKNHRVPIFAVTSDSLEVGHLQARQLAAILPGGGCALYIQGPSDSATAKLRTDGLMEMRRDTLQLKMMKAQWTEASAYRAITAWLRLTTSQQSQIDVISAQNDAMAMGARKAFQEVLDQSARDRWLALPYLGCDGVPSTGQAWVKSGVLAATVIVPPLAGQALEMLAVALQTGAIPPELTYVAPTSFPAVETLAHRSSPPRAASASKS
jgi:ribose transport system substrate-binding protein